MFSAAADVLRRIGEDIRLIQEFIELGAKAKLSASEAMDAEAALGEIPDEFLDPIQVRLLFSTFDLKMLTSCGTCPMHRIETIFIGSLRLWKLYLDTKDKDRCRYIFFVN